MLFKVEPINDTVVSKVVEEKVEDKFSFSELKEEPVKKVPIKSQLNFKVDSKKKQDKLV